MSSDFLIIGGGGIGLSIARELHKRGAGKITLVDKGRIGSEASWAAAGMLAPNAECHTDNELFRLCTASNALYPQFAAELLEETGVNIELDRSGTLSLAFSDEEAAELDTKYEWQRNAGINVESLTADDICKLEPEISPSVRYGYLYPNDWQVENRKLIEALRRYCDMNGIDIVESTSVAGIVTEGGEVKKVRCSHGEIQADRVIFTVGAWLNDLLPTPNVKPIRGQMISLAGPTPRILHRVIYSPRGYLVPRADGRVLIGATVEDVGFSKEITPEAIASLKIAATEIAPNLERFQISEAWAGLRPFVEGEMPAIGRVPDIENAFVATGHYRNGILLAPVTARMIADEVLGTRPQQLGVPALAGLR